MSRDGRGSRQNTHATIHQSQNTYGLLYTMTSVIIDRIQVQRRLDVVDIMISGRRGTSYQGS
jgi:hypothetical protein